MTPRELVKLVGSAKRVASAVGLKQHSSVLRWREIPLKYVLKIEKAFSIPRFYLRPDFWERPPVQLQGETISHDHHSSMPYGVKT